MAGMGVDPFTMGLLSMFAGTNPEQAAPLLDSMGVPVPQLPTGATMDMTGVQQPGFSGVPGASLAPGMSLGLPAGSSTVGQTQQAPGMAQKNPLGALAGVKAPTPVQPIMSGGVSGGVRAPEVQKMQMGSPAIDALMQALLQRSAGPAVPTLGEMVRSGRYG